MKVRISELKTGDVFRCGNSVYILDDLLTCINLTTGIAKYDADFPRHRETFVTKLKKIRVRELK